MPAHVIRLRPTIGIGKCGPTGSGKYSRATVIEYCDGGTLVPRYQIGLIGGTLKIKTSGWLQSYERKRQVPVWRIGRWYFIWMSNQDYMWLSLERKHKGRAKKIYH